MFSASVVSSSLICSNLFAPPVDRLEELSCQMQVNGSVVATSNVKVAPRSTVKVVEIEGFLAKVTSRGESRFELEIYDPATPSRSYAEGVLRASSDQLKWSLWRRDILLEFACRTVEASTP
jgi:hypothetical protein